MSTRILPEVQVEIGTNKDSIIVDPYACAIRVKGKNVDFRKTIWHIPRETSQHVYFLIKREEGWITGKVLSIKHRPSPVPLRGLEIPLILKFNCPKLMTCLKMK